MLTNMFYQVPDEPNEADSSTPNFLIDQVDLIGGIEFIFLEVCTSVVRKLKSISKISMIGR